MADQEVPGRQSPSPAGDGKGDDAVHPPNPSLQSGVTGASDVPEARSVTSNISGSDFEDEDEEPQLRYHRLGGSLIDILKKDTARCVSMGLKVGDNGQQGGSMIARTVCSGDAS